ncbi:MAG: hypothetical protein JWO45_189, partial [Spartobacteria bacterium]|nr:hypothetical protein [Spartobacteria bacterium]
MTVMMLVLASLGVATPLVIIGDRLSVFIAPEPFLSIMGKVGGYNHLKQIGVGSTAGGMLLVSAIGGGIFGWFMRRRNTGSNTALTIMVFVLFPLVAVGVLLWPVLGTNYRGLPIEAARLVTLVGFVLCVFVYERVLIGGYRFLRQRKSESDEFTPSIGRRAIILGGLGLILAGGAAALVRKLYTAATFSYDGTQYKGRVVQPITPTDQFYCVTKNIVDPRVDASLWHLEINGLVQNPRTFRLEDIKKLTSVKQETTLMCISNGLDAGLMSNAIWKGVPMRDLLSAAAPLANAAKVR